MVLVGLKFISWSPATHQTVKMVEDFDVVGGLGIVPRKAAAERDTVIFGVLVRHHDAYRASVDGVPEHVGQSAVGALIVCLGVIDRWFIVSQTACRVIR